MHSLGEKKNNKKRWIGVAVIVSTNTSLCYLTNVLSTEYSSKIYLPSYSQFLQETAHEPVFSETQNVSRTCGKGNNSNDNKQHQQ